MQVSAKAVAFFLIVWIIGTWFSATYNGASNFDTITYTSGATDNASQIMNSMTGGAVDSQSLPLIGSIPFIAPAANMFLNIGHVIFWKFSFLTPFPMVQNVISLFGTMLFFSLIVLLIQSVRGNVTWGNWLFMPVYRKPDYPQHDKKRNRWVWKNV